MNRRARQLCLALVWPALVAAHAAAPDPRQLEFFEQRVRPILANECYECHGPAKQKGGLRVDYRDGLRRGGDAGPALLPGDPRKSLLLQSIRHETDSPMPKDRPKLSDAVVADFNRWIADGAFDPRDEPSRETNAAAAGWPAAFAARKDWWSFKPVQPRPVPAVRDTGWSAQPVDRFLLAAMEARGLVPAADADRRTLLRRVTYALTGLPPTPAEISAFLQDTNRGAYERVVDRLLASPRFGEHWARHWMDLVRYAETHGSEGDPEIPHAWRYRDYLIRAFNTDVPWDQLIREHVAGDLLPSPRWNREEALNESVLGLAHLRLVEHGFNPVDTLDEQIKTVDSQIDVVSKAFQGLTTSCARCHDHKFDPISQRDYYALQGVLASARPTHVTIDDPARLRVHRERLEALHRDLRQALAKAWLRGAGELTTVLRAATNGEPVLPPIPGDSLRQQIAAQEQQLSTLEETGRAAAWRVRGITHAGGTTPAPLSAWTFDAGARDDVGALHGELVGGARVERGRLVLDGKGAFVRTSPLERTIRERTFEAWVAPATLEQGGGGVISIESLDGVVFDSLVFAEKQPRKWMAGSDNFRRGRDLDAPPETAGSNDLVHMVVTYGTDHRITLYRNGQPYGAGYTPAGENATVRTYETGRARVLLGLRHTGGGRPYFAGEVEEARLYDRVLTAEQVLASFRAGPGLVTAADIVRALTPEQQAQRARLTNTLAADRRRLERDFPDFTTRDAARAQTAGALRAAGKDSRHPLALWAALRRSDGGKWPEAWHTQRNRHATESAERAKFNAEHFKVAWDLTGPEARQWFRHGINSPEVIPVPGSFAVEPEGERMLAGLWPAGVFSHRLSQKHNGVLASPRFRIEHDFISVLVTGGKGARVRVIPDHYPIGQGNIYPQATLKSDAPTWVRLDTAYRKGTLAYLEVATAGEVTSRDRATAGPGDRSYFGLQRVVFHNGRQTPKDIATPLDALLAEPAPGGASALAGFIGRALTNAINAWQRDEMTEPQRQLLDSFVRPGLLPVRAVEVPGAGLPLDEYRRLENEIPAPRRAPGVWEATAHDAPFLPRGDHLKPQDPVPRAYLELVGSRPYGTTASGRLELAGELTSPANPLTARVLVNRVWHHLFGRGLVGTVDNFGRLGDRPAHPELLDFLAARFVTNGWSAKRLIRELVTTRTYQLSSHIPPLARELDPENLLLSHARTRRLPAESIRDSLLAAGGRLDFTMSGPGDNALAAPRQQRRRSVYFTIRRNFLSPFLDTFDAPRPFTTLGRRDHTTVPAQSLTLLNDPFVIEAAAAWAERARRDAADADETVRAMFETAFARPPSAQELAESRAYLADLATAHGAGAQAFIWRDFAQSLFNLKEFIYVR